MLEDTNSLDGAPNEKEIWIPNVGLLMMPKTQDFYDIFQKDKMIKTGTVDLMKWASKIYFSQNLSQADKYRIKPKMLVLK